MQKYEHMVQSPEGLHARPAMLLTRFAGSISSKITVSYHGRKADARHIMELFSLGAKCGAKVTFMVEGTHEIEDLKSLIDFCERNI